MTTSDRDTLTDLLKETADRASSFQFHIGHYRGVAEQVLAAGWRPPAQVITGPAELDTLPIMSIVLAYGVAHQAVPSERGGALEWLKPAGQRTYTSAELLTACRGKGVTVLYEPVDEDEDPDCPHDSRSGADGRWRCDQCGADCGPDTYLTEGASR